MLYVFIDVLCFSSVCVLTVPGKAKDEFPLKWTKKLISSMRAQTSKWKLTVKELFIPCNHTQGQKFILSSENVTWPLPKSVKRIWNYAHVTRLYGRGAGIYRQSRAIRCAAVTTASKPVRVWRTRKRFSLACEPWPRCLDEHHQHLSWPVFCQWQ